MTKTSWPFIEWTETVNEEGVKKLEVKEELVIGDDLVGNMDSITKVELFSCGFKPHSLFISGEKVVGIMAENRSGEYFYHALFEDAHVGEKKKLKILIRGESTVEILKQNGYYSNFAWNSKHTQRVIFPKEWKILSAIPKGYILETFRGTPSIVWSRNARFWGDVQVKILKDEF